MSIPSNLQAVFEKLPAEAQASVKRDFSNKSKSTISAYLFLLLLGWHYLYMGRVGMQFAFWFTFGGFFVWWIVDIFRLGGMINKYNEDVARELMVQYKALGE